ncbi:unnamed protein product [Acanthosepion pharaonis]|uniref:Uncharacterized protein n=1 Tax=Acanthosepion pharaonis TaxID=158019 RepID=A0A812E8P1_ACAPH|nr:unnamed protein product [Sepia pharaonis]
MQAAAMALRGRSARHRMGFDRGGAIACGREADDGQNRIGVGQHPASAGGQDRNARALCRDRFRSARDIATAAGSQTTMAIMSAGASVTDCWSPGGDRARHLGATGDHGAGDASGDDLGGGVAGRSAPAAPAARRRGRAPRLCPGGARAVVVLGVGLRLCLRDRGAGQSGADAS